MPLNTEQEAALTAIESWATADDSPFFVLSGSAGTGKTFCLQNLIPRIKGRMVFTAPTNKATKVLREALKSDEYKPDCRTVYSLLGLRLEANGEVKELANPEDPIDLSKFRIAVVDEAFMVNRVLMQAIEDAVEKSGVKFLFLGDPCQLPPVKEDVSPVAKLQCPAAHLSKVMRHDNQILTLATELRRAIGLPFPRLNLKADNDGQQGVWYMDTAKFERHLSAAVTKGAFCRPNGCKAIAWRNTTVDRLNRLIRSRIFDDTSQPWLREDRVIFTAPAKDLEDEPMASTDDEGTVTEVYEDHHPFYNDFRIYRIAITLDDNRLAVARVLHPDSIAAYATRCEELAAKARMNRRLWKEFWNFKDAFHSLRHAYAITAHRAQGSTYDSVFVDMRDILCNQNRNEAMRCLYVACTRPKRVLVIG